jgi:hypothetical protein
MIKCSEWITSTIDIDRSSEFTGDDVDQFGDLIDLGENYENLLVIIPTITSATVSIYIQMDEAIDSVPVVLHILDDDATGSFLHATTAATTTNVCIYRIGAARFIRLRANANQLADRTFYVRGFNAQVHGI